MKQHNDRGLFLQSSYREDHTMELMFVISNHKT